MSNTKSSSPGPRLDQLGKVCRGGHKDQNKPKIRISSSVVLEGATHCGDFLLTLVHAEAANGNMDTIESKLQKMTEVDSFDVFKIFMSLLSPSNITVSRFTEEQQSITGDAREFVKKMMDILNSLSDTPSFGKAMQKCDVALQLRIEMALHCLRATKNLIGRQFKTPYVLKKNTDRISVPDPGQTGQHSKCGRFFPSSDQLNADYSLLSAVPPIWSIEEILNTEDFAYTMKGCRLGAVCIAVIHNGAPTLCCLLGNLVIVELTILDRINGQSIFSVGQIIEHKYVLDLAWIKWPSSDMMQDGHCTPLWIDILSQQLISGSLNNNYRAGVEIESFVKEMCESKQLELWNKLSEKLKKVRNRKDELLGKRACVRVSKFRERTQYVVRVGSFSVISARCDSENKVMKVIMLHYVDLVNSLLSKLEASEGKELTEQRHIHASSHEAQATAIPLSNSLFKQGTSQNETSQRRAKRKPKNKRGAGVEEKENANSAQYSKKSFDNCSNKRKKPKMRDSNLK